MPGIHETGSWEGELQYCNPVQENVLEMHTLCFIVRDPNTGEPQYLAHVGLDITARKHQERLRAVREQRVVRLNEALVALARNKLLFRGDLEKSFRLLTETAGLAMDVDRLGVWLLQPNRNALECLDLYDRKAGKHEKGMVLDESQYPEYLRTVNLDSLVFADDVLRDPRWAHLVATYLKPLGIRSLMFAPIQVGGRTIGLVSHANQRESHSWSAEEQSFAMAVAGLVGTIVDANERRVMESALRLARDELERRVEQRTEQLARANEQLREAQVELEHRVEARTEELSHTNESLKLLLAEQTVNVELANRMLAMIHPPLKRYSTLAGGAQLFVTGRYVPCHAAGGDHYFMRRVMRGSEQRPFSHISLKDQSGHEVGCVLRCTMTDLIHLALLQDQTLSGVEQVMSRLNDEVCSSGFFGEDGFFTSINLDIDHRTLETRFVSTGHPPFLLIRGSEVLRIPDSQQPGANLPAGMLPGQRYSAGTMRLEPGDRVLLYSDGLFELPRLQGNPASGSTELQQLVVSMLRDSPEMTVSDLIAAVFERFGLFEREGHPFPVLTDDVALVGLEVEPASAWIETVLQPSDHDHFSRLSEELYETVAREWQEHGFVMPEFRLRLALEESLLN
ncbi:MAG TPA: SpoIIE family protein phosphatase, partial [Candidatus Ozemobacteraceae bacterium]|nr:SpoIIE family protein phosphatase [Candidatus Ozemobacteraceae bacterium]